MKSSSFYVDGFSAIAEFMRVRPGALVRLRCASRSVDAVREFAALHAWGGEVVCDDDIKGAIRAETLIGCLDFSTAMASGILQSSIVALDHIQDPQNLGSIVRICAFFGIRSVLIPDRRQVGLSQVSVSISQGGYAHTDLVICKNLGRALDDLKSNGFWILGADMNCEPVESVSTFYPRFTLVLGSEGDGLSKMIRERCDRFVSVTSRPGGLESLNVASACGILLYNLVETCRAS